MSGMKLTPAQTRRIQKAIDSVPYAHLLGIELVEVHQGLATLGFTIRKDLTQNHGVVHGGAIASLIDTAMALAIISALPAGERVTTVNLTIQYLRPLTKGRVTARGKVVRVGRRLITVSADVSAGDGKLAATALSTYTKL
jgi:uncharacterized protein (TIGR00369 family)